MIRLRGKIAIYGCLALAICLTACGKKGAKDYYEDGLKCMDGKNYEEAVGYFAKAIQENDERAEYFIAHGMALIECERYDEAITQFEMAVREKDNRIIRENNKHAYRGMGVAHLRAGRFEEAYNQLDEAAKIKDLPELDEDLLGYQTEAKLGLGDAEAALDGYNRLIKENGKEASYYMGRASVRMLLEDEEGAIQDYDAAIRYGGQLGEAKLAKYLLQVEMGDEEGAEETLADVLEMKPKDNREKLCLAVAKYYNGEGEEVLGDLEGIGEAGLKESYYYIASIYQDKGDYANAIAYYTQYHEEGADTPGAKFYNQIVACHMALEQYEEALEWVGRWKGEGSGAEDLRFNEVVLYERLGDFDTAYHKANEYMGQYPDDEAMGNELAFITTRVSGKLKKEIKAAKKAAKAAEEGVGSAAPAPDDGGSDAGPSMSPEPSASPGVTTSPGSATSVEPTEGSASTVKPSSATSPKPSASLD